MATTLIRRLLVAICVLGLAANASARDRDFSGGWKLGHGHDHYGIYRFDGRGWRHMSGTATAVGDGWVIGTDRRSGGFGIYRWNGRGWNRVPGGAVSIGGSYEQPWVINNRGEQFYWNGYGWDPASRSNRRYLDDQRSNAFSNDYHGENSRRRDRGHR